MISIRRAFLIVLLALQLTSCSKKEHDVSCNNVGRISINAESSTRTNISDGVLSFVDNDSFVLFMGDINKSKLSNSGQSSVNHFHGEFDRLFVSHPSIQYVGFYPYSTSSSPENVGFTLNNRQAAPFDASANAMYSDIVTAKYDEDDVPQLSLTFHQYLGLVKLSITNTDTSVASEKIVQISISSDSSYLTGRFSFNVLSGTYDYDGSASISHTATSVFGSTPSLGTNDKHEVYLFVKPGSIVEPMIKVTTTHYVYTYQSSSTLMTAPDECTVTQTLDLATKFDRKERTTSHRVVVWGDSYSNRGDPNSDCNYSTHLKEFLGPDCIVTNGAVSGDWTGNIAARQGGNPIYLRNQVTLPASKTAVSAELVFAKNDKWEDVDVPYPSGTMSYVNPCTINGVLCNISKNTIARVSASTEETVIPADTRVYTNGYTSYRNDDIVIIYMGQNGRWGGSNASSTADLKILADQIQGMIDITTSGKYLVLGFHNYRWNTTFVDYFTERFGDHFVDIHKPIVDDYKSMLVRVGAYATEEEVVGTQDEAYALSGQWPISMWYKEGDIHPGKYGGRAIAILIYERMQELGYID